MLRHWRCAVILLGSLAAVKHLPLTLPAPTAHAQSADFVAPEECAACHRGIWETWRQTGMGRSFSRPTPANTVEDYAQHNTFYHRASDSYFTMFRRDSKYYQRRHQLGFDGKQVNILEKQIDYIMGSGNHARAYLHRTPANKLIELRWCLVVTLVIHNPKWSPECGSELVPGRLLATPVRVRTVHVKARRG